MKIKVKKLHKDAVIPKYATNGSSGFDLIALENIHLSPGETKLIRTGLSVEIDPGYELQVRPRSGLSLKTSLRIANSPGTVDSDFRGEICIVMTNIASDWDQVDIGKTKGYQITKGERVAQGVICPIVRVEFETTEFLTETIRGEGGFGSSGIK